MVALYPTARTHQSRSLVYAMFGAKMMGHEEMVVFSPEGKRRVDLTAQEEGGEEP